VSIDEKTVQTISNFSNNLATVAHNLFNQLCYDLDILETSQTRIDLQNVDFNKTIKGYIESKEDTYKKSLVKGISQKREVKYNNGLIILKAIIELGNGQYSYAEIFAQIKKSEADYPPGNLTLYLKSLCSSERDEILVFDEDSNKFTFRDPFMFGFAKMYFKDLYPDEDVLDLETVKKSLSERIEIKVLNNMTKSIIDSMLRM